MPLIRTIQINKGTKIGIWKITEPESYFLPDISPQKEISSLPKRLQHLAGRKILHELESTFPVNKIHIQPSGKPCLINEAFDFSISHSRNYAAAIVSENHKVGIDVEKISPKLIKVAPKFLSKKEFMEMPSNIVTYALCWSAKEAIYKWQGERGILFREHIQLAPFQAKEKGIINSLFHYRSFEKELQLHYKVGKEFVLVWVVD